MIRELLDLLKTIKPGQARDAVELEKALAQVWDEFTGSNEGGMAGHKLKDGRMESITWNPPLLDFGIERHEGTVRGSTRAEVQRWTVDLDEMIAQITRFTKRQLRPMAPAIREEDMRRKALEIADLIERGEVDQRQKTAGSKLRPAGSSVKAPSGQLLGVEGDSSSSRAPASASAAPTPS